MLKKILAAGLLLWGCGDTGPYLKHDLDYEKIGSCENIRSGIGVDANTIGERYVLEQCLDASFKGDYTVDRRGDTVEVKFKKQGGPGALYRITLDINTRPEYKYLTVDGATFGVNVKRY